MDAMKQHQYANSETVMSIYPAHRFALKWKIHMFFSLSFVSVDYIEPMI